MAKKYTNNQIKVPRFNEEGGFYTTPERSKIMSKIRAKNSKPEVLDKGKPHTKSTGSIAKSHNSYS